MTELLTHASFFTGAGGLDLGLERAGWTTVSASEVDPYACALIEQRGVPNLGDIRDIDPEVIPDATLWTGGFPCQDLSKAGKRRGFGGDRSVLAFTFLDLVERRQPRWIVLENVDGLLTSNDGRDLARLLGEMDGLGYGVAWRTLDAQFFGVAQRRRRVFLVGSRGSDRAAAVFFDPGSGRGDPPPSRPSGPGVAGIAGVGADIAGALTGRYAKGVNTTADDGAVVVVRTLAGPRTTRPYDDRGDIGGGLVVGPAPDASRVREVDGVAGRAHDRPGLETASALTRTIANGPDVAHAQAGWLVASGGFRNDPDGAEMLVATLGNKGPFAASSEFSGSLRAGGNGGGDTVPIVAFRKATKPQTDEDPGRWEPTDVIDTLSPMTVGATVILEPPGDEDPLLPLGLDTNRYRMTGNGVVAPVAEWIGRQVRAEIERAS